MAKKNYVEETTTMVMSADIGSDGNTVVDNYTIPNEVVYDNNSNTATEPVVESEPVVEPTPRTRKSPTKSPDPDPEPTNNDDTGGETMPTVNVAGYSTFSSVDLSGATPTGVEAPKEVIHKGADMLWQYDFVWDKAAGATFAPGEFCMRRIYMNPDFIDDSKWINDFEPATPTTPEPDPDNP